MRFFFQYFLQSCELSSKLTKTFSVADKHIVLIELLEKANQFVGTNQMQITIYSVHFGRYE